MEYFFKFKILIKNMKKKYITIFVLFHFLISCNKNNLDFQSIKSKDTTMEETKDSIEKKNISFPIKNSFSEKYLQKNFWQCNYNNKKAGYKIKYWIVLPINVKPLELDPLPIDGMDLINIGRYQNIDKKFPFIEVTVYYEEIKNKISPADWLLNKLKLSKETILKSRELQFKGQKYIDILTTVTDNGDSIITRHTVYSKENVYFCVRVDCNAENYPVLDQTMQLITSNFGF